MPTSCWKWAWTFPISPRVFRRLKQMGLKVEPVYTMEQAIETIKKLKEGK